MPKRTQIQLIKKPTETGQVGGQRGNCNALKHGCYADLSRRNLDGRTKLAKVMRAVEGELVSAIGGDPSPQEKILIGRVTFKLLKCFLFESASLNGGHPSDDHYLALSNSLRLDLTALGLERRAKRIPTLTEYLRERYGSNDSNYSGEGIAGQGSKQDRSNLGSVDENPAGEKAQ